MRFADILLMAAECEVEIGSLAKAQEYVNMIRTRAATTVVMQDGGPAAKYVIKNYTTPWTDKTLARTAVRFERKLELAMEGHRFFDLVRWGTDVNDINAYLKVDSQFLPNTLGAGATYQAKHALLPLPQGQIDLLNQTEKILTQNPGY